MNRSPSSALFLAVFALLISAPMAHADTTTLPGNETITATLNGQTETFNTPIPVFENGHTFGTSFIESLVMPTSTIASTVAIGVNNGLTITGNASSVASQDILNSDFATTYGQTGGAPLTGTMQNTGGFQAAVYIDNAPGTVFNSIRGIVIHQANNSADTISYMQGIQPILTENAGSIGTYIDYACDNFDAIPGGGTIKNSYCISNQDPEKTIYSQGPLLLSGSTATLTMSSLATPAGAYLAVNAKGQVVATTTPPFVAGASGTSPWLTNGSALYEKSGDVGIGTNNPNAFFSIDATGFPSATSTSLLVLHGQAGQTGDYFDFFNSANTKLVSINSSGNFSAYEGGSFSGNVGSIGSVLQVNTQAGSNGVKVQMAAPVASAKAFTIFNTTNTHQYFDINSLGQEAIGAATVAGGPWLSVQAGGTSPYGNQQPLFDVASVTSSSLQTSSLFRVNSNGNVGIGTANPSEALDVNGSINVEGPANGIILHDTANANCYIIQVTNGVITANSHACQ